MRQKSRVYHQDLLVNCLNNIGMLHSLLEHKHLKNPRALKIAVYEGRTKAVSLLLEYGHDPNITYNCEKKSILRGVVHEKYKNIIKRPIFFYAPNEQWGKPSISILQLAVLKKHDDIVKLLLEHGANVNYKNTLGMTALYMGIHNIHTLRILLDYGAEINITLQQHKTILNYAIENCSDDVVRLLIERCSDVNYVNPHRTGYFYPNIDYWCPNDAYDNSSDNRSPLAVAIDSKRSNIVKCLLAHGSSLNDIVLDRLSPKNTALKGHYILVPPDFIKIRGITETNKIIDIINKYKRFFLLAPLAINMERLYRHTDLFNVSILRGVFQYLG
jgi:ankyrin repeat protein